MLKSWGDIPSILSWDKKIPKIKLGDLDLPCLPYFLAGAAAGAGAGAAAVTGATNGGGATHGAGSGVPAFLYFMATALIDWHN
jgi:hypothetical protein